MSHLRHEIFNRFGVSLRGMTMSHLRHGLAEEARLVAILTTSCHAKLSTKSLGISCRNRDTESDSQNATETRGYFIRGRQGGARIEVAASGGRERASRAGEWRRDGGVLAAPLGGVATDETGPTPIPR
jgi:hypothetical protein